MKGYLGKFKESGEMQGEASYICKRAVEVFGKDTQLLMYFEEAGELAQAISKDKRGFGSKDNIAEEIADVEVMLEQLKHIYVVERMKQQKIVRLSSRIEQRLKQQKEMKMQHGGR